MNTVKGNDLSRLANVTVSTIVLAFEIVDIFVSSDIAVNFEALKKTQELPVTDKGVEYWRGAIMSIEQIIVPVQTSPIATTQPTVSLMLTVRSAKLTQHLSI